MAAQHRGGALRLAGAERGIIGVTRDDEVRRFRDPIPVLDEPTDAAAS